MIKATIVVSLNDNFSLVYIVTDHYIFLVDRIDPHKFQIGVHSMREQFEIKDNKVVHHSISVHKCFVRFEISRFV